MVQKQYLLMWCGRTSVAAICVLALVLGGCTAIGGLGSSNTTTTEPASAPAASNSPSMTEKISSFFSRSSASAPQPVAGAQPDLNLNCPFIDIREGASTLTIGPTGDKAAAMALKYQGTFVRAARECAAAGGDMVMRIGIQGRVIVGPAGGPGQVTVPVRIAIVQETTSGAKVITTKLIRIPVTIGPNDLNTVFTHVEEGLAFPMPSRTELDDYKVYIGFDALAAEAQENQKPKPRPKPKS